MKIPQSYFIFDKLTFNLKKRNIYFVRFEFVYIALKYTLSYNATLQKYNFTKMSKNKSLC